MKIYRQFGALVGAGGFLLLTLLFWHIASIGLVEWLLADAVCAAVGAIVGSMIHSAHHETG